MKTNTNVKFGETTTPNTDTMPEKGTCCQENNLEENNDDKKSLLEMELEIQSTTMKCEDIIHDFIRLVYNYPFHCKVALLMTLRNERMAVRNAVGPKNIPSIQFVEDATKIMEISDLLDKDFSKEHDHAAQVLDEILSRYVTKQQQEMWALEVKKQNE